MSRDKGIYTRDESGRWASIDGLQGRRGEALNQGIPPRADAQHPYSKERNYFEWWYFDATFEDGHHVLLELQVPNLMRPWKDQCCMLFHITQPGGEQMINFVFFPGSDFRASSETCDVAIAGNTIKGEYPEYQVKFTHQDHACDLTFRNLCPGWGRGSGEMCFGDPSRPHIFGWMVAQPRAEVTGTLTVNGVTHEVKGKGYHDHNWANCAMPFYLPYWHWGRLMIGEITMIFADVVTRARFGHRHIPIFFIARGDRILFEGGDGEFQASDYVMDDDGVQVYPRRLRFEFGEGDTSGWMEFKVREVVEVTDSLKRMGLPSPLIKLVGKTVARPAYYRFFSDYRGELDLAGEKISLDDTTYHEYMVLALRQGQIPDF